MNGQSMREALQEQRLRKHVELLTLERKIKALRSEGLSYATIANRIGKTPAFVSDVVNGRRKWQQAEK